VTQSVQLPDGTVLQFPDGMSRDDMRAAIERHLGKATRVIGTTPDGGRFVQSASGAVSFTSPGYSTGDPENVKRLMDGAGIKDVVQSGFDQTTIEQNPVAARANELVRGVPFAGSRADEAVGLFSPKAADAMRKTTAAMQRERPKETMGLNLTGAVAGSVPMAVAGAPLLGRVPWASSKVGQVAQGLGIGAAAGGLEGLIYGSGEGQTPQERAEMAVRQGVQGAAFGGVLGGAAPLAGNFVRALITRWRGEDVSLIAKQFGVSRDAAKVLKTAFANNDASAVDRILRAGGEATLADSGRSGMALLDAAAASGGDALNTVRGATDARAARSLSAVNSGLDDTLGPVMGPRAAARQVADASRATRSAAYGRAYETPIDYATAGGTGEQVLGVLNRLDAKTVQEAAEVANRKMRWDDVGSPQLLIDVADDGSWSFAGELPNVRQLDELKKALNQMDQASRDTFGRTTDGGLLSGQARAVRDAAVDATGGPGGTYASALKVGGDKVEMDRGLELGLSMLRDTDKTTREIVSETLAPMSQDGRAMVRLGLRAHIDEVLGRVKMIASDPDSMQAREAMQALRILTSGNAKSKLKTLLGPDEFDRLWPKINEAISSQEMSAAVATNSKTAFRQNIAGQVEDIVSPGVVGRAARGEPVGATQALVQELLNTTAGADATRRAAIWSDIARALSEKRGSRSAQAALNYVQDAISGQAITDQQAQLIAREIAATGVLSGGRSMQQLTAGR